MKKMKLLTLYYTSIFIIAILLLLYYVCILSKLRDGEIVSKETTIPSEQQTNRDANYWIVNNNVAQYSVCIIPTSAAGDLIEYQIEAFIIVNDKHFNVTSKNEFKCLLKNADGEVLQLEAYDMPRTQETMQLKLYFKFKVNDFSDEESFDLNNLLVAVIRKADFSRDVDEYEANMILPYDMITYQRPKILQTQESNRPAVSLCVHYTYSIPTNILNFIDLHLSVGIAEIMFYDGTDNQELTTLLNKHYPRDARLSIMPYLIEKSDLCLDYEDPVMAETCSRFYNDSFSDKYERRGRHEQVTANECYSILSRKYDFVAYYDLDEYILPRTFDLTVFNKQFKCNDDDRQSICNNYTPFVDSTKQNFYYNYIQSLIGEYNNGRQDIDRLASIYFAHGSFFIPNHVEKILMNEIEVTLKKIESNATTTRLFPIHMVLHEPPSKRNHTFIITENDVDYLRSLYRNYKTLVPCVYDGHVKKEASSSGIDESMLRYLYLITEKKQRLGKTIHYKKNVKTISIHHAIEIENNAWKLNPSEYNAHFLMHFRKDVGNIYKKNFINSIRKLNIDYEYLFYLLKNHTSYCKQK